MKKLLSVVLTLAMLAGMLSVPMAAGASSYTTIELSSGFVADNSFGNSNFTETAVYGIAGKDSADESVKLTEKANLYTSWYQYNHGEELYFENGKPMEGYLVAELNFMAPDAAYLKEFIFGISTNQHRMTVDPTKQIKIGKWNHLRMVYYADETNCDFHDFSNDVPNIAGARLGSTELYLNGVSLGTKNIVATASNKSTGTIFDAPANTILLEVYSGDKKAQHYTYYDDIKIYKSAQNPGAQSNAALAATQEYTVSGTTITLAGGAQLTPAEIEEGNSGYTITAFEDETLTAQLSDSATLAYGNMVVAKSPDGVYTYYDVKDATLKMLYNENNAGLTGVVKASITAASGVAGKRADDESALLTTNSAYDGNIMISLSPYAKSKKYLVMEANVNPVHGADKAYMSSLSIHTASHTTVAGGAGMTLGQWNRYLMYLDQDANKSYVYVNGELKSTKENVTTGVTQLRFCMNGAGGKAVPFSVYVDDMKWYETDNLPDGAARTAKPVPAASTMYSVSGGKIKALADTKVADIKSANTAFKTRVYTDASMTTYAEDSAQVCTGMTVALENSFNSLAVYPVAVTYGEAELYLATGDSSSPFPAVNNTTKEEIVTTGYAGKEGAVLKIVQENGGDTWFGTSWGTTKAGTDSAGTGATWDKLNFKGCLVVEFSIFNIDCTTVDVVTDGSNGVCTGIASYIPKNQWSRVRVVVDAVNGVKGGKAYAYVDGVKTPIAASHNLATVHSDKTLRNDLRFRIKGGSSPSYVDDIRIYEIPALRPEQVIDFTAPDGCSAAGYDFTYGFGTNVTVGAVKAANPGVEVRVFDNKTSYTEITDEAALLAEGNVIFVNIQSQSAFDAGFNCKDLFKIMTVKQGASSKDVVSALPTGAVRGTVSGVSGGMFGNTSATIKKVSGPSSESNWFFAQPHDGMSEGMKYLVFVTDFAPTSYTKSLFIGANGHAPLSDTINVGNELTANQWHRLIMVYDIAADTSDMYVNGKLVSEDFKATYSAILANPSNKGSVNLRFIVYGDVDTDCYFDNFRIYESAIYPEIGAGAVLDAGYNAAVNGFVDNSSMVVSIKNGTTADVTVPGYDITVVDGGYNAVSGAIKTGDIMLVKRDGNFAYYNATALAVNDIVILGDNYNANTGVMTPGSINVYGVTTDGGVVVVAQFDESNNLIATDFSSTADANGIINLAFDAEDIDDTVVKVFLVNDLEHVTPLCVKKDIMHSREVNLLMLGNSFSMDVTCYMEEIAAAMGKKVNIHILNKGGSSVEYHYTNRETEINFFKNSDRVVKSNLKTVLESYDYDYIVLQNWGSTPAFYANTDENYAANWAVTTDLAEYISEREPGAELMLHEIWSFEAGYNDFTDSEVCAAVSENICALYDRCAADVASALGLEAPIRKISSLSAFDAAKAYTNAEGVHVFETTYDGTKHEFEFEDVEKRNIDVGDGTMLLSDADAAAGKISLYRDGFHASQAGRYLIALNAIQTLTGKSVYGNTFRPGQINLDSAGRWMDTGADMGESSGTVYQKYDALAENVVSMIQNIVNGLKK